MTPTSANISGSSTTGYRKYVDDQTTFIVGEGSNLTNGTAENTGAIIGTTGNGQMNINNYVGKDLQNIDYTTTTGGSMGLSTGKYPVTGIGVNQENREKAGVTRNTVIGNVEIGQASGDAINRDIDKANETTYQRESSTNINVESQLIRAITNPSEHKKEVDAAKQEVKDVVNAISNSVNDKGDDNRNFLGQLRARRQDTTMKNIAHNDLKTAQEALKNKEISVEEFQQAVKQIAENTGAQLGVDIEILYTDSENMPNDSKNSGGVAKKIGDGKYQLYINVDSIGSTSELIGTIFEEVAHSIDENAGRQDTSMTQEQKDNGDYGLESLGRPTNDYFQEQYKENSKDITAKSDGNDYSEAEGETIGEYCPTALAGVGGCKQGAIATSIRRIGENFKPLQINSFNPDDLGKIFLMSPSLMLNLYQTAKDFGTSYFSNKIKKSDYKSNDTSLKRDLMGLSLSKGYLPSTYFGIYYLDKETQNNLKYFEKDEDNVFELRFDKFDKEGWNRIKTSKAYENIMNKSNKETWKTAYNLLKKNESVDTWEKPIGNDSVTEKFASNLEIITEPGGLPITLRTSTMKSNTRMKAKQTKNGFEVLIWKQYKLYDEFKEPYNVEVIKGKIVEITALTKAESGTPYKMSSGYRDLYIYSHTFKNRFEALKFLKNKVEDTVK